MRENDSGVGQQPAPIARMMPALAQIDRKVEIHRAAGAEEDRWPLRREARSVRGDQHIGGEAVLVLPAHLAQPRRADLLTGLDQEDRIEAEPAARPEDAVERAEGDRGLA